MFRRLITRVSAASARACTIAPYTRGILTTSPWRAGTGVRFHSSSTLSSGDSRPLPHECPIEQVLLPELNSISGNGLRTDTLRGMVQLLIDLDATDVEDVSMVDFVSMVPRRQLTALRGRRDWLDIIVSSERYQACRDARALRLAGITTVGRWDENRDRVPLSLYSRGLLEEAYAATARRPTELQKDQVIMWLTRTIQCAVLDEFVANKSNRKILAPLITGMQAALPSTAVVAAAKECSESGSGTGSDDIVAKGRQNTSNDLALTGGGKDDPGKLDEAVRGRDKRCARSGEEDSGDAAEGKAAVAGRGLVAGTKKVEKKVSVSDDAGSTRVQRAMEVPASEQLQSQQVRGGDTTVGMATEPATVKSKRGRKKGSGRAALNKMHQHQEGGEGSEEEGTSSGDANVADAVKTVTPTPQASARLEQDEALVRLSELMLNQFNSADGYLHLSDLDKDEKNGFIIPVDGEVAQVDPFALYSAFSSATPSKNDTPEITALKHVWSAYNSYSEAREAAADDKMSVRFYKEKGVEALVHAAVLLRVISRGNTVTVDPKMIPPYGFPLISSDRRPHGARRGKAVTDMTPVKVEEATRAFTAFFANKNHRYTPIRPAIDFNSGCSVAAIMGTTLHLYETSLKSTVREENIRCRFAEAMLGILHILHKGVLARVNVVHYHILATSLNGGGGYGGYNAVDNTRASIVSIDTSGPFTPGERKRLQQLAEPLGMSSAIAECGSVSDIIETIEEFSVSVAHDILMNRDDLEALLTPTLVQLLPEASEDDMDEEEELVRPTRRGASKSVPARTGSAVPTKMKATSRSEKGIKDDENMERSRPVKVAKIKPSAVKAAVSNRSESESAGEEGDYEEEEEGEEEEEMEEEEGEEESSAGSVPTAVSFPAKKTSTPGRGQSPKSHTSAAEDLSTKGTEEECGEGEEEEEEEEYEEEEVEEEVVTSRCMPAHASKKAVQPVRKAPQQTQQQEESMPRRGQIVRKRAPVVEEKHYDDEQEEEQEEEEEEEEVVRPPVKKSLPLRRATSSPLRSGAGAREEYEDDEAEEVAPRPRVRPGGNVVTNRRVGRPPSQSSPSSLGVGDKERWFDRR
ncbi:hypothetical protein TRVL_03433 [Trypanosoma vivax]|nr:hypothetical protein TRVL_03433 [Trypanosoma vivax]